MKFLLYIFLTEDYFYIIILSFKNRELKFFLKYFFSLLKAMLFFNNINYTNEITILL